MFIQPIGEASRSSVAANFLLKALGISVASASILLAVIYSISGVQALSPLKSLSSSMAQFVPAIAMSAKWSRHAEFTAAVLSLNWLCVPLYFVLIVFAKPVWNNAVREGFVARTNDWNALHWLLCPVLFLSFICSDFGWVKGPSFFRMDFSYGVQNHVPYRIADSIPLASALQHFCICLAQPFIYFLLIFFIATLYQRAKSKMLTNIHRR